MYKTNRREFLKAAPAAIFAIFLGGSTREVSTSSQCRKLIDSLNQNPDASLLKLAGQCAVDDAGMISVVQEGSGIRTREYKGECNPGDCPPGTKVKDWRTLGE